MPLSPTSLVCRFVNHAREQGEVLHSAKRIILGVQRFYPHTGVLRRSWRAYTSWKDKLPHRNRIPVPECVVQRMFLEALSIAGGCDKVLAAIWFGFAVILRVMFYAILRPSEGVNLRRGNIYFARHFL